MRRATGWGVGSASPESDCCVMVGICASCMSRMFPDGATCNRAHSAAVVRGGPGISLLSLRDQSPLRPLRAYAPIQVGDVERVFGTLRADVEALFMTAPSVDLEQLHADLASMHAFVNEQVCLGSGKAPAHGRETIRRRTRSHFVRMWTQYCCWHCALFCIASFMYCTGASAACNTLTGCNRILCPIGTHGVWCRSPCRSRCGLSYLIEEA